MNIKTLTAALATAALLAACGTTKTTAPAAGAKPSTLTQAADGTLIGPDGRTLYEFARDVAGSAGYDSTSRWRSTSGARSLRSSGSA